MEFISLNRASFGGDLARYDRYNDIISYGLHNRMPEMQLAAYGQSPTLSGALNKLAQLTARDFEAAFGQLDPASQQFVNTWQGGRGANRLAMLLARDWWIYGGCAVQLEIFSDGAPGIVRYIPWPTLRIGFEPIAGSTLERKGYRYKPLWSMSQESIFYPSWPPESVPAEPGTYIYAYTRESPDFAYYPLPLWYPAYLSVLTEIETIRFKYNSVTNSFVPSGVLVVPSPTQTSKAGEAKKQLEAEIRDKLMGVDNVGGVMVVTTDGGTDELAPKYIPFQVNPYSTDVSNYINESRQDIITALGLASPTVLGLPGGASLGGDGNTIAEARESLQRDVILPLQEDMANWLQSIIDYERAY